jgi:outer membrane murein-binding lipoprotein Lpp
MSTQDARGRSCQSNTGRGAAGANIMRKIGFGKLPVVAALALGGVCLSACVTQEYVDQRIDEVNTHINAVDAKATNAEQRADAAMSAAQAAQATAAQVSQRVDSLTTEVDSFRRGPPRAPRG